MGSAGNPTAWPPYDSYKDCSLGICSIYCPQWCYMVFPPPPPLDLQDDDSGTTFSPLIIAIIAILGSAFLLVSYFTIISKYCNRSDQNPSPDQELNQNQVAQDQWQQFDSTTGLDESIIKSITVRKFKKGDGSIEGMDCAVCLSEFQENENLRLMPKCNHAFHIPCIDTWLTSHSNCPLCRSNLAQDSSTLNISLLEIRRRNDLILVIADQDRVHQEEVLDVIPKNSFETSSDLGNSESRISMVEENEEEGVQQMRRSASFGSNLSCQRRLLIADILQISEEEEEEDLQVKSCQSQMH